MIFIVTTCVHFGGPMKDEVLNIFSEYVLVFNLKIGIIDNVPKQLQRPNLSMT